MAAFAPPLLLSVPAGFEGRPVFAPGTHRSSPYGDLNLHSLAIPGTVEAAVVRMANQMADTSLAATAVTRDLDHLAGSTEDAAFCAALKARFGDRNRFLVAPQSGHGTFLGQVPFDSLTVWNFASTSPGEVQRMELQSQVVRRNSSTRLANLGGLLDPRSDEIVLEFGCGTDIDRISFLNLLCRNRGGHFIAQDAAPFVVRSLQSRHSGSTPIFLPALAQFICPALSVGRPVTTFLAQSALSSFSLDSMAQWLTAADQLEVKRILLTQDITLGQGSPLWQGCLPQDDPQWAGLVRAEADKYLHFEQQRLCGAMYLTEISGQHAVCGFAMALAAAHLIERAKQTTSFQRARIICDRTFEFCDGADAEGVFAGLSQAMPPAAMQLFYRGMVNVVRASASGAGVGLDYDPSVPLGSLKLEFTRLHLELSRGDHLDPLPHAAPGSELWEGSVTDFVCPTNRPFVTPQDTNALIAITRNSLPEPMLPMPSHPLEHIHAGIRLAWQWHRQIMGDSDLISPLGNRYDWLIDQALTRVT